MMMKLRNRALMEAANYKGTGEIRRRVHVLYFLTRMGHVEQPHLLRVHHLAGANGGGGGGVYLRDVKRWLAELRGKAMPEAFSWSYKRKYKTGYVWQDLMNDDLITPISDNEYVLQGSQIIPTTLFDNNSLLSCSSSQRKKSTLKEELESNEDYGSKRRAKEESPSFDSERSTVTDDGDSSMKVEEERKKLETAKQGAEEAIEESEGFKTQYSSLYAKLVNNKKEIKDKADKKHMKKEGGPTATSAVSSSQPAFTKSKSYSTGASNVIRQWITCGAVDINDTVLVKNSSPKHPPLEKHKNDAVVCRDAVLGGSARVIGNSWDVSLEIRRQQSARFDDSRKKRQKESDKKTTTATTNYKPMAGPNCSLCGKTFRPEKMHSHMKSCRGLKSGHKTTSFKSTTTTTSDKEYLSSNYLLTN